MTRIELAIKALEALPEDRREEIADIVLDVVASYSADSALTEEQWAEVRRRDGENFEPADPDHFDKLIARLS